MSLHERVLAWLSRRVAETRSPDVVIGGAESPYLLRWWLILRSDEDRALHDHPWWNVSWLLRGAYTEHTIAAGGVHVHTVREAGAVKARRAGAAHRIELHAGPCWTLFVTGPRLRDWGFHCPQGWRHWRDFTNPLDGGRTVGRGCADDDRGGASSPTGAGHDH